MSDVLTKEQRHRNMAAIRSFSTRPEQVLRHALWRQGFRYRLNDKRFPGRPDIVLTKYRTIIFIHGCFWHGHKSCKYYAVPKTNTEFWVLKVERNQARDQEVWRKLEAKGWNVIVVWECQLKKESIDETVKRVTEEIVKNGEVYRNEQENRRKAQEKYRQERKAKRERERILLKELS